MSLTKVNCAEEGYNPHYWHVATKIGSENIAYLFTDSQLKTARQRAIKLALQPAARLSWWDKWTKAKQL